MPAAGNALVLFPGSLGDFICFLPALLALRQRHRGRLQVVARPALLSLLHPRWIEPISIDRREVADLFGGEPLNAPTRRLFAANGTVYSWTGAGKAGVATRLAEASGGEVRMFRFRAMGPGEHATDYYTRCVEADVFPDIAAAIGGGRSPTNCHRLLVVHPGSGAAAKNWEGMNELVAAWAQLTELVVLLGPAEIERDIAVPPQVRVASGLSLPSVVELLRDAAGYLGNDSGVSHLAGALGVPSVVLFGPSDPLQWRPRGSRTVVLHAPRACAACGSGRFCTHRLPVDTVAGALRELHRRSPDYS